MWLKSRGFLIISCFALCTTASGTENQSPVLSVTLNGSTPLVSVSDKFTMRPDGTVELLSRAPFPFKMIQNSIGHFVLKADAGRYERVSSTLRKNCVPKSKFELRAESISVEFSAEDAKYDCAWLWNQNTNMRSLEDELSKMKEAALDTPSAALKLECKKNAEKTSCSFIALGSSPVTTVDPSGMPNSIFCFDGVKKVLNKDLDNYDPQKMKPQFVYLRPTKQYRFEVKAKCVGRIWVETSDLRLNPEYNNAILGTLISNSLND